MNSKSICFVMMLSLFVISLLNGGCTGKIRATYMSTSCEKLLPLMSVEQVTNIMARHTFNYRVKFDQRECMVRAWMAPGMHSCEYVLSYIRRPETVWEGPSEHCKFYFNKYNRLVAFKYISSSHWSLRGKTIWVRGVDASRLSTVETDEERRIAAQLGAQVTNGIIQ